jgi:hypothetical protein
MGIVVRLRGELGGTPTHGNLLGTKGVHSVIHGPEQAGEVIALLGRSKNWR